jgi:hypothetical protein
MLPKVRKLALVVVGIGAALGCTPRARPLRGTPVPVRLPAAQLSPDHQRLDFRWEYREGQIVARGEGVARIAPPDSARVDVFLDGGYGGGRALLLGDTLLAPGGDAVKRYLPPAPLLWAAFGRLAVPASPDTVARQDGEMLRADIGSRPVWRASFRGERLAGLERIEENRIVERVERSAEGARYSNDGARRSLVLTVTRSQGVPDFDPSIWRP